MMIPDTYLMAGIVGGVAALALLFYWGWKRGKAPAKRVFVEDPDEWMRKHIEPMEAPAPAPKVAAPLKGELNEFLEGALMGAAKNSKLNLTVTIPDGAEVKLFGVDGWKVAGKVEIGGEDKDEPKPPEQNKEKPESVT